MIGLRRHLRGRLHLFGVTERDFVMPPPDDPRVRRCRAGLELALIDALAEVERQRRRGLLVVAWPGAGTRMFLEGLPEDGSPVLRLDAKEALGHGAGRSPWGKDRHGETPPVVVVDGLHGLDPGDAERASGVLQRWMDERPETRFVVTTRPGAVPPDRLGPRFLEVRVAGLDEPARRHLVGACLARLRGGGGGRRGPTREEASARVDDLLGRLAGPGRRAPGAFRLLTSPLALAALTVLDVGGAPLPADGQGLWETWRRQAPDDRGLLGPRGEAALRAFAEATVDRGTSPPETSWVGIPPGRFRMGSPDDEEGRWADEGPVHDVRVHGFELGARPVTNGAYAAWLEADPGAPVPAWWDDPEFSRPDQPVVGVGWDEARAYAAWAGARLPSEAEWEYACRAGTTGPRYGELGEIAWYRGNSGATLHATGRRRANPWGVHDTLGNAWEWVEDDHHGDYVGAPDDGRPWVDRPRSPHRILRGGSWADAPRVPRAATRLLDHPGPRVGNVGFRVARSRRRRIDVGGADAAEGSTVPAAAGGSDVGEAAGTGRAPGTAGASGPGDAPAATDVDGAGESVAVAVVGGGIAGSAVAVTLARLGLDCAVYERVEADRATGLGVILMPDGIAALERLGLADEVRARGVTARSAERRSPTGEILSEKELPEHVCLFRRDLVAILQAELSADVLRWGREVRALEGGSGGDARRLALEPGPAVLARAVVGADGRSSLVRETLFAGAGVLRTDVRELISVIHAPSLAGELTGRLVKYVSPEGALAVGLAPTTGGRVFWYVQFDARRGGPAGRDPASLAAWAEEVTGGWRGPVPDLVAATDYRESYMADVTTMTPLDRIARGPVVLVGDAAHPLPTLLGEGANTALEDATWLAEEIATDPEDLPGAFARFDRRRRPRLARLHEEGRRAVRRFLESTPTRPLPP